MSNKNISKVLIALAVVGILLYSLLGSQPSFDEKVLESRANYLDNMKDNPESPIADLSDFKEFKYFAPNENWKIEADFKAQSTNDDFQIMMTDGSMEQLPLAGIASFEKDGIKVALQVFDEGKTFMIPFNDLTNRQETYGGGRYINVPKTSKNSIVIDFNEAHNFYCAYNASFICPIPPKENSINLRVEAGELKLN